MTNVSNIIEQFILSVIGDESSIQISRNELANYFSVAPSQINYVLSTRFCLDKGYIVESRRGGGGFISVVRISQEENEILPALVKQIDDMEVLTYNKAVDMVDRLEHESIVSEEEGKIIKSAISDKALSAPIQSERLRKNVFKEIIVGLMKR